MENDKVNPFIQGPTCNTAQVHSFVRRCRILVESTPEKLAPMSSRPRLISTGTESYEQHNADINSGVQIELYKLLPPRVRRFDDVGGDLTPTDPNLYDDTIMGVVADENIPYGFKLTNNTEYDLYPNRYYFDVSDLSIGKSFPPVFLIDSYLVPRQVHITKCLHNRGIYT